MNLSTEQIALDRAKVDLSKRLDQELSNLNSNPQAAVIQLIQAEKVLEAYLTTISSGIGLFPDRREIAWSCLVLLIIGDEFNENDYNSVARLYATDIDVSLHDIAPEVKQMRDRIISKWENMLDTDQSPAKPDPENSPF